MPDHAPAELHLGQVDPVMRKLIRELGPCTLSRPRGLTPYRALVRAVAHQQLNGAVAERILARLIALTPGPDYPTPAELLALPDGALRQVGFSTAKALALRDIAEKTLAGIIPTLRHLARLEDEAAILRLIEVRGVGRWTAEILLIRAGRPDVLPVDDFGLRNGFRHAYRKRQLPAPRELRAFGERWRPFRTVASWYLWRAADRARETQNR
ncbi:MAG TPA: DNA-3-methyladenine glycosylase 2 family protein [Polyangia bacterium]|nr:DNA-3-methyladenine glycosylase 2 family protein [Polyangia bacterium]